MGLGKFKLPLFGQVEVECCLICSVFVVLSCLKFCFYYCRDWEKKKELKKTGEQRQTRVDPDACRCDATRKLYQMYLDTTWIYFVFLSAKKSCFVNLPLELEG